MTAPVPDAALTAALGGYYGHPTAITEADPDVVDGHYGSRIRAALGQPVTCTCFACVPVNPWGTS